MQLIVTCSVSLNLFFTIRNVFLVVISHNSFIFTGLLPSLDNELATKAELVELKGLKLYINSYRDLYIPHEEVVNQILDDFVAACDPLQAKVKGDFTPRGNVHTVIEVHHQKS